MDLKILLELVAQGGPVAFSALFCWMWWLERRERQSAQQNLLVQSNATIQALTKFEAVLEKISR